MKKSVIRLLALNLVVLLLLAFPFAASASSGTFLSYGWTSIDVSRGEIEELYFYPNETTWVEFSFSTGSNLAIYDADAVYDPDPQPIWSIFDTTRGRDTLEVKFDKDRDYIILYIYDSYYSPRVYLKKYNKLVETAWDDGTYVFTPSVTGYYNCPETPYDLEDKSYCYSEYDGSYYLVKNNEYRFYLDAGQCVTLKKTIQEQKNELFLGTNYSVEDENVFDAPAAGWYSFFVVTSATLELYDGEQLIGEYKTGSARDFYVKLGSKEYDVNYTAPKRRLDIERCEQLIGTKATKYGQYWFNVDRSGLYQSDSTIYDEKNNIPERVDGYYYLEEGKTYFSGFGTGKGISYYCTDHTYDNACDKDCNTCGDIRSIEHNYDAATCIAPKTCTICKATSGNNLGHTYTNDCDADCNRCKATRTPAAHKDGTATCKEKAKCSVCGVAYGSLSEHKFGDYVYNNDATASKDGTKTRTCSVCKKSETITAAGTKLINPFSDVTATKFYYEPVLWAANSGVTTGTSATSFSPNNDCTRGQIVTFLWRAAGSPEPKSTNNPFTDVKADKFYYKAVLWAVENGITTGTSATTFSPNNPCTRGQVVTFLWRAKSKPAASGSNAFKDVKSGAYYYDAVRWAVKNEITNGMSATSFAPNATCTRGQIVTFLYRAYK